MKQFKMFLVLCFRQSLYLLCVLNAIRCLVYWLGYPATVSGQYWKLQKPMEKISFVLDQIQGEIWVINISPDSLIRNPFLSTAPPPNPLHPLVRNADEVLKCCIFGREFFFFPQKQIYASQNSVSKQLKFFRNLGQI